ncbi:carboxyvinyl-carboxyphosphonate phosphorylmutase [Aliihoeflea aestuarii]|uniref:isocitrate lyase/PEP mutase family protein n=1 Tax=Aliihoeflea aestuarii TaxID=453840 RepID=UPI0020957B2E|nr:isocitrate lyase/phosphoenolpyruvate mutase family protein [Aliihoeflea aestuarii]MCO6392673.1 carboxyvinyl-carboxyphosphonate phosphorylmutase [Aliihoeflea aestuarii]
MTTLSALLDSDRNVVLAPGVYDPFTAHLATEAGFEVLYLSGASIAYTRLGRPDIGLVSMSEVAETIALVRDRTPVPLIVDADTGYGNALNVQRTMRVFERAGASAIQLEDQSFPKRCGHLAGKSLVSAAEMGGKIRAAVDARANRSTLVIARTDAIAVEGFDAAMERANHYVEAGADVLFIEAPRSREQMVKVCETFSSRIPLLANMVEGGQTPIGSASELGKIGFKIVIFPGGIVRAVVKQAQDYYASLKTNGSNRPFADRMTDFDGLNAAIGTADLLSKGNTYES